MADARLVQSIPGSGAPEAPRAARKITRVAVAFLKAFAVVSGLVVGIVIGPWVGAVIGYVLT